MSLNRGRSSAARSGRMASRSLGRTRARHKPALPSCVKSLGAARIKRRSKTFIPVVIVGPQAEACAETLELGDMACLEGKLAYKAGKTKNSGTRQVVAFGVGRLTKATVAVSAT
jgi:Single-strand binding protein family